MIFRNVLFFFFLVLASSHTFSAAQAQMTNLCNGCSTQINAHGVCKNIYNGAGAAIMIPWNNSSEWYTFYARGHSGVSVSDCAPPPPPPPSGSWQFYAWSEEGAACHPYDTCNDYGANIGVACSSIGTTCKRTVNNEGSSCSYLICQ